MVSECSRRVRGVVVVAALPRSKWQSMELVDLTKPASGSSRIPGMDTGVNDTQLCEASEEEASGAAADAIKVVGDAERGGRGRCC